MRLLRSAFFFAAITGILLVAGCGSGEPCMLVSLVVNPSAATLDHTAASPANGQQFYTSGQAGPGCAAIATIIRRDVRWSVSNTTAAQISNVNDATYGFATCVAASANPITVTATLDASKNNGKQVTGTATLTCR